MHHVVTAPVVRRLLDPVEDGVAHRRARATPCRSCARSTRVPGLEVPRLHAREEVEVLGDADRVPVRAIGRPGSVSVPRSARVLLARQVAHVGLAALDQLRTAKSWKLLEVVGRVVEVLAPVGSRATRMSRWMPSTKLGILGATGSCRRSAGGSGQPKSRAIAEVDADRLRVCPMWRIAVRLGREARARRGHRASNGRPRRPSAT